MKTSSANTTCSTHPATKPRYCVKRLFLYIGASSKFLNKSFQPQGNKSGVDTSWRQIGFGDYNILVFRLFGKAIVDNFFFAAQLELIHVEQRHLDSFSGFCRAVI